MKYTKREFEKLLKDKLMSECNVTIDAASADQIYRCLAMITRQIMSDRQKQYQSKVLGEGKKQVYYLCMEFLMGRSLRTSLFNLGLTRLPRACWLMPTSRSIPSMSRSRCGPGQRRSGPPGRLLSGRHGHRRHPRHRLLHPVRVRHLQAEDRGRLAAGNC